MQTFVSKFRRIGPVTLPEFTGIRVMMLPIVIGDTNSIPFFISNWKATLYHLFEAFQHFKNRVGYVTIDERLIKAGCTLRRSGLHVDGVYQANAGGWGGGGGGSWGGVSPARHDTGGGWGGGGGGSWGGGGGGGGGGSWGGGGGGSWGSSGLLTASSPAGCRAYAGAFNGYPGPEGECDHLADQCDEGELLESDTLYWLDGLCVHESLPMPEDTRRSFIRLSGPSTAPWFKGYTENPLGVLPSGPILPRRQFMDA